MSDQAVFALTPKQDGIAYSTKPKLESINGKPALQLPGDDRPIGEFAEELGILLRDQPIFVRHGSAFVLNPLAEKLEPASPTWLRSWVEKSVTPYVLKKGRDGEQMKFARTMSEDVARAVLASTQFLSQLCEVKLFSPCRLPVMRQDGTIELLIPGYDAESMTFTGVDAPEITPMSTEEAKALIAEVLEEFPFASDGNRSQAVAVAAMLTVFASGLLPKRALRPCFLYVGNAEGCGKTSLARIASVPYTAADVRGAPTTEEEFEKVLSSAVIGGRKVLLLDNLKGRLNSAKLEGFLSATRYGGRILGVSKEFSCEVDITVLLTGNGLIISPDLRRRTLLVELFMPELRAEDRRFTRVLDDAAIHKMRSKILSALWRLIQDWDMEGGRPKASRSNTSFPRWCDTIGGIVEYAGFGCPTAPAAIEGAGDTDTADIARLAESMELNHRYEFSEVVEAAEIEGLFERFISDTEHEGSLTRKAKSTFAKLLLTYRDRHVTSSKRFSVEGKGRSRRYLVV